MTPLALTATMTGELLGVDASTVRRNASAGIMPKPVKVGTAVRWRLREIEAWLAAGCPRVADWIWQTCESPS